MSTNGPASRIVGFVMWGDDSRAELFADGSWRATHGGRIDDWLSGRLAVLYAEWDDPASLRYGQSILPDLARLMEGKCVFHRPSPLGPDDIP